jgi:hypothetical protein
MPIIDRGTEVSGKTSTPEGGIISTELEEERLLPSLSAAQEDEGRGNVRGDGGRHRELVQLLDMRSGGIST